ncbi:hypothetical protein [Corynebacterium pacaense]|uniref:hypothetical protein n=1 Tax=Corynebacterium pacaense TaxID=1816684 RepID=UPI001FE6B8E3|nr:hypothetical protein [Corynebacterium pacaense]
MKTTMIFMPGSPALVPDLAPADPAGPGLLAQLRQEIEGAVADAGSTVVIVGSHGEQMRTGDRGSFRAWGAPQVNVGRGNHLPELLARFALGPYADRVCGFVPTLASISDGADSPAVVIAVVDGSTGLSERAPSALLPGAAEVDTWCRDLLAGKRVGSRSAEDLKVAGIREPALWVEAQRLQPQVTAARLVAADVSLGVGRYVAVWQLGEGQ